MSERSRPGPSTKSSRSPASSSSATTAAMGATLAVNPGASNANGEVAGFGIWITSYVAFVLFLLWAFIPERFLHRAGVYYYPSKYWALSVPAYLCTMVVCLIVLYIGSNLYMTNPLQSRFTYIDKFSVPMTRKPRQSGCADFEEIRDIPLHVINKILYQTKAPAASSPSPSPATLSPASSSFH